MTRKTWPLFLGSFVVPALLIAACSADTDDDDDGDNGGSGNSDTSGAGSTRNSTTARTGSGNTNTGATTGRFGTSTNRSNSGGVLNRGGASAGGRSNQFNTAGAVAKAGSGNANAAGSAGKASGLAGMAGADSGSGGATSTTAANGGSATGGTTAVGVAGAAGAGAICPDGCASIGLTLANTASADYAVEISSTVTYANGSLTLAASLYAPGAQNGRVRLVVLNADGDDCTSTWTNLADLASGFATITKDLSGCDVTDASLVGIRIANNSGSEKTYSLHVNALTLASTTPPKNVTWAPASAAAISATAPDVGILGPVTAVTGATLTYLND